MGYWWWVESAANPSPRLDSLLTGKKYTENVKFARRPRRLWISRYLIFESFYQIYSETDTSPNRELSPGIRELAFPDTSPKMRYVRKATIRLSGLLPRNLPSQWANRHSLFWATCPNSYEITRHPLHFKALAGRAHSPGCGAQASNRSARSLPRLMLACFAVELD